MIKSRRALPALLVVLVLLAASGCGSGSSKVRSADTTASPAAVTPGLPTTTPTAGDPKARALFKELAEHMLAAGSVHFEQRGTQTVSGDFVVHGTRTDYDVKSSVAGNDASKFEVRAVGGTIYLSIPTETGPGKFAKVGTKGTLSTLLASVTSMQPGKSLITVAPAIISIRDAGAAAIDHQRTEHYVFQIDSLKAHELLNPGVTVSDEVLKKLPKVSEYNMYVSPLHLVRRVVIDVLGKPMVIDYIGWGSAIRVRPPARADLVATPAGF